MYAQHQPKHLLYSTLIYSFVQLFNQINNKEATAGKI